MFVRSTIGIGMAVVAVVSLTVLFPITPVAAEPPMRVPARLAIGSTFVVPAPCRLNASDRLTYEFDPLFQSPTYFIQFLDGPAATDGSVRLRVPADATPGRYVLRGTCEIVRPPGEITSPLDQYATIDPVEVELFVGPGFTG
ncbi:MAG: hypothetical protein ACKOIA_01320 [Acidimicrobiia bacterium]